MPDYATYDPGTGARVSPASGPDAHVATDSFKDRWYLRFERASD